MTVTGPTRDTFGAYRLIKKIGAGGMADVYRAERRGAGGLVKPVAIKRILPHLASDDHFVRMFIDEARIAASLDHSNIVAIHDFGRVDDQLFLAMELVEGWNLAQVLRRLRQEQRLFPLSHALFIALEVCKGLHAAHARTVDGKPAPVVHRDVSPHNVLISTAGEVKLVDFGVAKTAERLSVTQVDSLKGKLAYMSPEQASANEVDARSDIFSMGLVLHELLTSERLFQGRHEAELLLKVLGEPIVPPSKTRPTLAPEIDAVVMKALQREVPRRYQSIAELGRDISAFLLATRIETSAVALSEFLRTLFPEDYPAPEPPPPLPESHGNLLRGIVAQQMGKLDEAPAAEHAEAGVTGEQLVRPAHDDTPATSPGHSQTQLVSLVRDLAGSVASYDDVGLWVQVALLARLGLISSKATEKRDRIISAIANAARGSGINRPRPDAPSSETENTDL